MRKILILVCLGVLLAAGDVQAAASLVQSNYVVTDGNDPYTLNFSSNVTTGNAVIVAIVRGAGLNTWTISDATNGTYTQDVTNLQTGNQVVIASKRNVTGGFTGVTATPAAGVAYAFAIYEVSGLDNGASVQTGQIDESSTTSHVCTDTGLSATGFALCAAQFADTVTTITAGSGYTLTSPGSSDQKIVQYGIGTWSNNTGPYTTDPTIGTWAAMAIYAEATGGGAVKHNLLLLGVGR